MMKYINKNTIVLKPNPPKKRRTLHPALKSAIREDVTAGVKKGLFIPIQTARHEHLKQAYREYLLRVTKMPYKAISPNVKGLERIG